MSTSSFTPIDSIKFLKDQIFPKDLILFIILVPAFFLRVWKLPERMVFSGETNNMLYYVESYLRGEKPILMGLEAAQYVHHLFHLPWYLWLMIPLFIFGNGNPLVFAWFHAVIGVVNTFLLYRIGSKWSHRTGILATFIYAAWMRTITIDRFVSPVSLVPFGVIVSLWLFLWARSKPSIRRFFLVGFSVGAAVSFHYALLVPVVGLLIVLWWKYRQYSFAAMLGVIAAFLPMIIFDLRHQFFNLTGLWYVGRSLFDETRPYGLSHFIYQLLPIVILVVSWVLSKTAGPISIFIIIAFAVVQSLQFIRYEIHPNYRDRLNVASEILSHWNDGVSVYFQNESSFDYGYLLRYEAKQRGLDSESIEIYEPWQPENSATVVVTNVQVSKSSPR